MIAKTFICDICKESVGEKELYSTEVHIKIPYNHYYRNLKCNKDICKPCLETKGIVIEKPPEERLEDVEEKNQKKLNNMLIDLLEHLGVAFED